MPYYYRLGELPHKRHVQFRKPAGGLSRNGQAYEVWFAHEGSGVIHTQFGRLAFGPGDYVVIPYGTTWRMDLDGPARFFVIESPSQIEPPRRYPNELRPLPE